MRKTKGITAAELLHKLGEDEQWAAERQQRDARLAALTAAYSAEERLLVMDLRRAGCAIKGSVYDLVNTRASYADAIPVLLSHLRRPYTDRIKEGIARALTVRQARGIAGSAVIDALQHAGSNDRHCRWALANALTVVASQNDREGLQRLFDAEHDEHVRERLKVALHTASKP